MTDLALLAGPQIRTLAYNWLRVSQPKPFQVSRPAVQSQTQTRRTAASTLLVFPWLATCIVWLSYCAAGYFDV